MTTAMDLLHGLTGRRLPVVLQAEASECGLACIAMIAGFHGLEVDINTLRRRYPISLRGARLHDMIDLAGQLGMSSRALRVDLDALPQIETPAILHWSMNHFVVLKRATRRELVVHDPDNGVRHVPYAEASKHFTGVALEITPSHAFQPERAVRRLRLRDLWTRIRGLGGALAQVFAVSFIIQALMLVLPLQMQIVVDEALAVEDRDLLLVLLLGFSGVVVIHALSQAVRGRMLAFLSAQLQLQMSNNLFHHLIRLPLTFFERRHIGDVVSRFGSTRQINQVLSHRLIAALMDGMFSIATVIMMLVYELRLAAIALGFTAVYALARLALLIPLRRRTLEEIAMSARENSTFIETLRAIQSIRLFGAEPLRETVWRNQFAARMNARIRVALIEVLQDLSRNLLIRLQSVVLLFFGARMVMADELSIGMLLAFIAYSVEFETRSTAFIQQMMQLRLVSLHLDRLADIVHTPPEQTETTLPGATRELRGELALRGLSFRYGRDEPLLFSEVHLHVRPGEFVAIAGPSGQGKSTLAKLALGLMEPLEGEVLVDGIPLRNFGLSAFRRQSATVMQEDQLLSGTIADNISFFDTQPDLERIHDCARQACIHEEIMRMPMAYDSMVGDMGTVLSGGQKQRILLARALYRRPSILFMDEGTAHLDVETERAVNNNLRALSITRIVIAHRPDMLRAADRVVRLESGQLRQVDQPAVECVS